MRNGRSCPWMTLLWLLDVGDIAMGGGMWDAGGILSDAGMVVGPRQWLSAGCGRSTTVRR